MRGEAFASVSRSRLFICVLAGVSSLYVVAFTLINLLYQGLMVHSRWHAGGISEACLLILLVYGIIGGVFGVMVYLAESILLKKLRGVLNGYAYFSAVFLIASILSMLLFYNLFDTDILSYTLQTYMLVILILALGPPSVMLTHDILAVLGKILKYPALKYPLLLAFLLLGLFSLMTLSGKLNQYTPERNTPVIPPGVVTGRAPEQHGKCVIFGFDGATWDLMGPLLEQGRLPNIRRLVDSGVRANFTTIRYDGRIMSPVVWTTIFTGKKPEKHGITSFMFYVLRDNMLGVHRAPPASYNRKTKALWGILSDLNVSSVFSGPYATWPAEEVNGVMLSENFIFLPWPGGRGIATEGLTYPESVYGELRRFAVSPDVINLSIIGVNVGGESLAKYEVDTKNQNNLSLLKILSLSYRVDRNSIDSARYLYEKNRPDVLFIYLPGNDAVGHFFWSYRMAYVRPSNITPEDLTSFRDVAYAYYVFYDKVIGDFMEISPENTSFIILSDHGMKEFSGTENRTSIPAEAYGDHDPRGVLIMAGPPFKVNHTLSGASVLDFTPTLLYSMGLPVGGDMDGAVLRDAFAPEYINSTGYGVVDSYDVGYVPKLAETPVRQDVEGRLRDLGYIR